MDNQIGNLTEIVGTVNSEEIKGKDLEIVYGLEGNDLLKSANGSTTENAADATVLVGGSGNDHYDTIDESTAIIIENGNDDNDLFHGTDIKFFSETSYILEIENRHLLIGDRSTGQSGIIIDWQVSENRIENFTSIDAIFTYEQFVANFRNLDSYQGNFSWEELVASGELNLARLGLSADTVYIAIAQANERSNILEAQTEPQPQDRVLGLMGNLREIVASEANNNILGVDLQILYGLEGNDTLKPVEGSIEAVGADSIFVVGGSGNDSYVLSNFTTSVIIEHGNSDADVANVGNFGFDSATSYVAEISDKPNGQGVSPDRRLRNERSIVSQGETSDAFASRTTSDAFASRASQRHLLIGDVESRQSAIIVDWQQPENQLETFITQDREISYEEFAANYRNAVNFDELTWEELSESGLLNLEKLGLSGEIENAIAEAKEKSTLLEAEDLGSDEIMYRFYNPEFGIHLYTTDINERDFIVDQLDSYTFEGAVYKTEDPTGSADSTDVYRFNVAGGGYFYTADEVEKDYIVENLGHYSLETSSFAASKEETISNVPVYRFYEPTIGTHFFTSDEVEANYVIGNLTNYDYEGVAYYVRPIDSI